MDGLSGTRARLLSIIRSTPGMHVSELARRAGLGNTTTKHHIDGLRRNALVQCERMGNRLFVFPSGCESWQRHATALENYPTTMDTWRAVHLLCSAEQPWCTTMAIADIANLTRRRAQYHLGRLEAWEVIRVDREWRPHRISLLRSVGDFRGP